MLLILTSFVTIAHASRRLAIVRDDQGGVSLLHNFASNAIVNSELTDVNSVGGYYQLRSAASTAEHDTDEERAYYMGYAEGYLLAPQIQDHMRNVMDDTFSELYDGNWPSKFREYASESRARIVHNYHTHGLEPFWVATYLMSDRYISGLHAGYMRYSIDNPSLKLIDISEDEFYMLSSIGDWEIGLELLLYGDNETVIQSIEHRAAEQLYSHCSGCVRIADDLDEIFTGHATWTSWGFGFLRVMKIYDFNFQTLNTTAQQISFSSYPGFVSSVDDFYIVKGIEKTTGHPIKFSVIETSYNIMNTTAALSAISQASNTSVLTWSRAMAANLIASSAANWPEVFTNKISYTYNDNWLITDYAVLDTINSMCKTRGERDSYIRTHSPVILTSLEVVPGYYKSFDATSKLIHDGLYVSINVPADPYVRKYGYFHDDDPYEGSPRYSIFMREGTRVGNCKSMVTLMRHNSYKTDSASNKDPGNAIASRYDLRSYEECGKNPVPFGATDAKVVANYNFNDMSFWAIFGPTLGTHNDLPKFTFSDWPDLPHRGVPHNSLPVTTVPSLIIFKNSTPKSQSPIVTSVIIILLLAIISAVLGLVIRTVIHRKRVKLSNPKLVEGTENDEKRALINPDDPATVACTTQPVQGEKQ
ncbi:Lysophospholipase [Giardia duodenalis]|uniref:Phospholipase B-like n=1 Tax=Giardia intestinalis TaxID=5741 RepID=V6TGK9_GIAIN|nr:Lysophospholipase [Giardia intestinalis]